ncbi:hypothetical protein HGM15179_007204 [Zosterops borbonicus]|uniref:Uncharacterized protein n=1 Tax=Zosterops borbonicus TaxID=364589 RepID=A0A8K1LND8_9PASS|nr:hypothetical protein HGM15179_007204 [Zosterops borbonicus]
MRSRLLRSRNCNGIQTATNLLAPGGEMAAACEAFPWVQTHAVRRRITVTADPEHPELGHSSCQATVQGKGRGDLMWKISFGNVEQHRLANFCSSSQFIVDALSSHRNAIFRLYVRFHK